VYKHVYVCMCVCVYIYDGTIVCMHVCMFVFLYVCVYVWIDDGRHARVAKTIGCLKLQVIFHKRATNYRALLREMTYKDKACYAFFCVYG